jgi:hypothetical protein
MEFAEGAERRLSTEAKRNVQAAGLAKAQSREAILGRTSFNPFLTAFNLLDIRTEYF